MIAVGFRCCHLAVLPFSVADDQISWVDFVRQDVDDRFVGGHHDGRVRDLADQLGAETAVQSRLALLLPDGVDRLPEAAILVALLAQPGASDLVRIGHNAGNRLGRGARRHKLEEISGRLVVGRMGFP